MNDWRKDIKVKGIPLKLEKDKPVKLTFMDEGIETMGKKWGTENDYSVPQIEFQLRSEHGTQYTWYVKKKHDKVLIQIISLGQPLTGRKVQITLTGNGLKTKTSILDITPEEEKKTVFT